MKLDTALEVVKTIGLAITRTGGGILKFSVALIALDYAGTQIKEHWFTKKEKPNYQDDWRFPPPEWKKTEWRKW